MKLTLTEHESRICALYSTNLLHKRFRQKKNYLKDGVRDNFSAKDIGYQYILEQRP